MSFIACTSNCVYQQDGCCTLEHTAPRGDAIKPQDNCIHFIQKNNNVKQTNPFETF